MLGAAALIVGLPGAVLAQDPARGLLLAERWCVTCHVIGPDRAGGDAGPAFPAIAAREGQTLGGTMAWLFEPHPPMPDLRLSPNEYRDLAAYVMSLRE